MEHRRVRKGSPSQHTKSRRVTGSTVHPDCRLGELNGGSEQDFTYGSHLPFLDVRLGPVRTKLSRESKSISVFSKIYCKTKFFLSKNLLPLKFL